MPSSIVASVVFLKIQDFARRSATEQARLRAQLEAAIAVAAAELAPDRRVVLEASDGAAIVLLADAVGALRLAERALTASAAGLPLCAGLNHGALQLSGRKRSEGMTGDGIAVAASMAEFASSSLKLAARALASRAFRDALADAAPGSEAGLVPAGTFTDASLRTHEVFTHDERAVGRRRTRYAAAGIALFVLVVGAGIGWRMSNEGANPFVASVKAHPYVRALVQRVSP